MNKHYQIQCQFGKIWVTVKSFTFHKDALGHIASAKGTRYPMRIVRVVKTVVFESK